jgi:ubiquinone/menaquinone biosynthesis C-methylase UbiE
MAQEPNWQRFARSIAENYHEYLVPAIFQPWAEELVALAAPRPGERVLDVACGPGVVARLAARRAGPGRVTGLDINPGMVEVARSLPSEQLISWQVGTALQMPFGDETFDLVLCQQGVQFFPDRAAGLREMRRALAPGGRLVLAVWGPIELSPGFAAVAEALERHVSAAAAAAARSPFSLRGIGELRDLMEGAGFSEVEIHSRERMLHFSSPAEFVHRYAGSSLIAAEMHGEDPSVLDPAVLEVAEALRPYLDGHGVSFPLGSHLAAAVRRPDLDAPVVQRDEQEDLKERLKRLPADRPPVIAG